MPILQCLCCFCRNRALFVYSCLLKCLATINSINQCFEQLMLMRIFGIVVALIHEFMVNTETMFDLFVVAHKYFI